MIPYLLWIMAYMEVQGFEMWGKVKLEKLQNDPSLVSHSILFCVDERVSQCLFRCYAF